MVYFAVVTVHSRNVMTIPVQWLLGFNLVRCIKNGLKQKRGRLAFYSPNKNDEPNWKLNVNKSSGFDESLKGCFIVNILSSFGTREECDKFVALRRNILPIDYNEESDASTSDGEFEENRHAEMAHHIEEVLIKKEITAEQRNENVENITDAASIFDVETTEQQNEIVEIISDTDADAESTEKQNESAQSTEKQKESVENISATASTLEAESIETNDSENRQNTSLSFSLESIRSSIENLENAGNTSAIGPQVSQFFYIEFFFSVFNPFRFIFA